MRSWSWLALPRFVSFLKRCTADGVLLIFLGEMYKDHPMITFAPSIAKTICPSAQFVTQFEHLGLGMRPWQWRIWTRFFRKVFADWVASSGTDYAYGSLLHDSDRVIVLSDTHKAALANHNAELHKKCVLIPPPPTITICQGDDEFLKARGREALGMKEQDFLILYYGYIYPTKGVETLFHAFQAVASRHSQARLIIVGGVLEHRGGDEFSGGSRSYTEEIHNLPNALGIADKVTFTGPCPPESAQGSLYLRASDLCVLPFDGGIHLNNSSFAVAAAHGLPVVTTRGLALEAPFLHEENVFLCPPKDADALANAIQTLMIGDELRFRLRTGIQALAREWFSWERAADRIIETFGRTHPGIVEGDVGNVI